MKKCLVGILKSNHKGLARNQKSIETNEVSVIAYTPAIANKTPCLSKVIMKVSSQLSTAEFKFREEKQIQKFSKESIGVIY